MQELTDPSIPGLVLRVGPTGSKHWLLRYKWKGTSTRIVLGEFPAMSLLQAREEVSEDRSQIAEGIDPRTGALPANLKHNGNRRRIKPAKPPIATLPPPPEEEAKLDEAPTPKALPRITPPPPGDKLSIRYLAYEYAEHCVFPSRERPEEVIRILNKDILPSWGERDARTISQREVIEKLDEIIARGARVMANRTAKMLKQMFKYGIHRAIVAKSPAQPLFFSASRRQTGQDQIPAVVPFCKPLKKLNRNALSSAKLCVKGRQEPREIIPLRHVMDAEFERNEFHAFWSHTTLLQQ